MKGLKNFILNYSLLICAAGALLCGCEHKDLCYYHPHRAEMRVNVDWSGFDKTKPTGMTVKVYPASGERPYTQLSHNLAYAGFNIPAGFYSTLVFNQSETEYSTVSFRGMERYETAEVYTNTTRSNWYTSRAEEEKLASNPEWIGSDARQNLLVTEDMVDGSSQTYLTRPAGEGGYGHATLTTLAPTNIVSTITFRVHIRGIHNLRSARAAIEGLAEGFMLAERRPTDRPVTQLVENWTKVVDPNDYTRGYIEATLNCFGLPGDHEGLPEENKLKVSILLVDNKTVMDFDFAVGDKFERRNRADEIQVGINMEIEIDLGTTLPDVQPEDGGSGGSMFDATVDDWGEEERVEIEM